jgi:hypothetical protein
MTTRITVSFHEKEHAARAALAEKNDVSLSWLTRKAVVEFLHQQNKGETRGVLDLVLRNKKSSK